MLPHASVLVTTRPSAIIDLHPIIRKISANNVKRIEVLGFSDESIQKYTKEAFGEGSEILLTLMLICRSILL